MKRFNLFMCRYVWTMETGLTGWCVLAMVFMLTGCEVEEDVGRVDDTAIIFGLMKNRSVRTYEFDGHKWVIYSSYNHGGIAHHPDCECYD